ncbi:MAG TPA: glycosyltransferase family 4 protein [Polyangiaceae bacterium]|nr:glycosyltransferase family 4 protein [Polyangiaceae bacterium]
MIADLHRHKPRILMTTDAVGGVFSYCRALATQLTRRGFEVGIATMGPAPSHEQREQLRAISGTSVFESDYALEWMDDPWAQVDAAGEWLLAIEREFAPDIVHLNGYCHAALPWRVPKVVVAHSCVLSWWKAVLGEPAPERYGEYAARVQQGLRAADCVVSPTQSFLSSLRGCYSFGSRARVIWNGAESSAAPTSERRACFIAAGRMWDRAKNLTLLERTAAELDWPVFVAGDVGPTPAQPSTENSARQAKREALKFLGRLSQSQLADILSSAAVFVHPARYEPFGLSVLEAALSGCALILGDLPSLRELWADAAIYVDPDDAAGFLQACRALTRDPERRQVLAARAQERAHAYSVERMGAAYQALYLGLLRARADRGRAASTSARLRTLEQSGANTVWD